MELLLREKASPTILDTAVERFLTSVNRQSDKKPISELIDTELLNKLLARELFEPLPFEKPQVGDLVIPI